MELRGTQGGTEELARLIDGSALPYPRSIAEVLSYLANLIDNSIAVRGVGIAVRDFAARFLRVGPTEILASSKPMSTMQYQLAGLVFARDLEGHPAVSVIGEDEEEPPEWEELDLGESKVSVPFNLAASFRAGTLADCDVVIHFEEEYHPARYSVTVYTRSADSTHGKKYLTSLVERSKGETNPFRGKVLEATSDGRFDLALRVSKIRPASRRDVILSDSIWQEVDRNVHAFFAALDDLRRAGLATNRGMLFAGPPGTGKTEICRVIASELSDTTVVFCDALSVINQVRSLYALVKDLAPAVVVIEDIDLVIGDRSENGRERALNDFLLALDGAMTNHVGVLTVATTNDLAAIDDAAKRSARFDRVVIVPKPDSTQRAAIIDRYLRELSSEVDAVTVAAATSGATGADLRELVGLAVLEVADPTNDGKSISTDLLLQLAGQEAWATGRRTGRLGFAPATKTH